MSYDPFGPEPAQFTGDTFLERVSRAYEAAVDAYGLAVDAAALAEAKYKRAFAEAWAVAVEDKVPATTRAKHCDNQPGVLEASIDFDRAAAAERRCRMKADELKNRQVAAMSHQRFIREAT
jgi:hypothetical protein